MESKGKTAIIFGSTGLTGSTLVHALLKDSRYNHLKLFSRSSIGFEHPKLEEILVDLFEIKQFDIHFKGDVVFCCIGTTANKTPNKELYRKIDYGIPVAAAQLAKRNKVDTFIVISALGANPKSKVFYNRLKGEMETSVLELNILRTYILQPSLISGKREEKRIGEWLFKQVMKIINLFLIWNFKKYRSIHPTHIAKAMIWLDNNSFEKVRIESDEISKISNL